MACSKLSAVLFALPAVFGTAPPQSEACGPSEDDCAPRVDDGASLLQMRSKVKASSGGESPIAQNIIDLLDQSAAVDHEQGFCPGVSVRPYSPAPISFAVDQLGATHLGFWNFPVQLEWSELEHHRAGLTKYRWGVDLERVSEEDSWPDIRGGSADAVMRVMNEATKLPGLFEKVPDKMRGVFWMKGNGIGEELTVMHAGLWFPEENTYYTTMQPYMWAWAHGMPRDAPDGGAMYRGGKPMHAGGNIIRTAVGFTYSFGKCDGHSYCRGQSGDDDDMAYAYMSLSRYSDLEKSTNLGEMITGTGVRAVTGAFTLQAMSEDGSKWKRTCNWGSGSCAFMEVGSYELLKVMDGDGNPVQPYYDEFIEYMGDVPLAAWTGWESEKDRETVAHRYEEMTK